MRRLLLSAAVLAVVAVSPGRSQAQILGVAVCGKTVGIGVSPAPAGVGYGYGYGAAYGAGLCGGVGYGVPGYGVGYGVPNYGVPQYGVPNYGYGYGTPNYGTSCHGGYGVGYGAPNYGASCYGGSYGAGASCYGGGYGMNYGAGDKCGNVGVGSPADANKKLKDLEKRMEDLERLGLPKLGGTKASPGRQPGTAGDDVGTMLAEIDRAQTRSAANRVGAAAPTQIAADEWEAMLAEVDRLQTETRVTRTLPPGTAGGPPASPRR